MRRHGEGEVDERESEAVVEPGLGGEREADPALIALTGPPDLDVGREHRIGRGQDRAQEQGRSRAEIQNPPAEKGDSCDRERHGDAQEPPGRGPAAPADRGVELEPGPHERDQDQKLGDPLGRLGRLLQTGNGIAGAGGTDGPAQEQKDHRHRERQLVHQQRQRRHAQHQGADEAEDDDIGVDQSGGHAPSASPGLARQAAERYEPASRPH